MLFVKVSARNWLFVFIILLSHYALKLLTIILALWALISNIELFNISSHCTTFTQRRNEILTRLRRYIYAFYFRFITPVD